MSEVASRPAPTRGRGTTRGRGGFRGGPRSRHTNGDIKDSRPDEADSGELGDLKKQYSRQLSSLKELFADWTDVDLLLALQETDGDLERTIDHISEGNVSQFSDVKKKAKDRSRSKVNETQPEPSSRPARGRSAIDSGRGGRGRTERGRGAPRAGRGGQSTSGPRGHASPTSIPTTESTAWEENGPSTSTTAPVTASKSTSEPLNNLRAASGPPKKTWASMFAPQAKPEVSPPKQPVVEPTPVHEAGAVPSSDISSGYVEVTHSDADTEAAPQLGESITSQEPHETVDHPSIEIDDSNINLPPSKDKLTEDNVEHLPDASGPAPIGTAASTVESSRGPDSTSISVVTQPTQPIPIGRPAIGGYATTALKATTPAGRSASFQRRILEQQEAVVMPGNHAVDRAAVQFGSLGLNGDVDSLDVDEDREELETRAQPPQHSPVAQPKTALPPAPRQEAAPQEPTVKPAPGLPLPTQQSAQLGGSQIGSQTAAQSQAGHGYNQFGRYGQTHDAAATQKQHYDPFGQPSQSSPYDPYAAQSQAPAQAQQTTTSQLGGFPSATNEYYSAEQQRNYQNYYGNYGQNAASQQDAGASQQRTGSAFGTGNESSFSATQSQQPQSRYGENQASSTPASAAAGTQHQATAGQNQQGHQQGHGQQGSYPYNHPYYNQPYYTAYMNQYQGYGQQGFGGPFAGKGGMYGHPQHGYGVPQASYDQHSSSPAMAGSFGREGALGAGLNSEYSRSGSTQPTQSQASTAGGFGSDVFGRSPGNYAGQTQQYGQQAGQQSASEDSLKPFGEKPTGTSASGSLGQPGRPTSATNSNQAGAAGLPPPQSHQGFGGYPSQFSQMQGGQASQYAAGGLGGLSGHQGAAQTHQAAGGYAGYAQGQGQGFGNNYQQSGYGQQRGGWGGNYGQGH